MGVLASPPFPIFDLLSSSLTYTLYSKVDSCYRTVPKHVPWNTFIGSTIRHVDVLKSECVVFEETQRHIVQADFQVWRWVTLSSTRKSYRVSRYDTLSSLVYDLRRVWTGLSVEKTQEYKYSQSQSIRSCLGLLLPMSQECF